MRRRSFLWGAALSVPWPCLPEKTGAAAAAAAQSLPMPLNLLSAPLEIGTAWPGSAPDAPRAVIERMRQACLGGIPLLSDRQPAKLRVDDQSTGPPHVWLHTDHPDTAWVVVDIGARDWSKLAYQFGHELGHVLCNSWQWGQGPRPPTQWLEESLVEAFSIRGLALLADSWQRNPPFPHNAGFAIHIRDYRANLLAGYREAAPADLAAWLRSGRPPPPAAIRAPEGPAVAPVLALLAADERCIEDMGAMNRWPARTALPVGDYLRRWQDSCAELKAPGVLAPRLRHLFGLV